VGPEKDHFSYIPFMLVISTHNKLCKYGLTVHTVFAVAFTNKQIKCEQLKNTLFSDMYRNGTTHFSIGKFVVP